MRSNGFLILLCIIFSFGCGGKTSHEVEPREKPEKHVQLHLPGPSGGFVVDVAGDTITSEEVVVPALEHLRELAQKTDFEEFNVKARVAIEQILAAKATNILLYQQARKKAGDNIDKALEKAVETEVRRFIVNFDGDIAKAELALKQMGMDWQSFKEYQKKMMLSQSYIATQMPKESPVTYTELLQLYDARKDDFFSTKPMIEFRLIDIQSEKIVPSETNVTRHEQTTSIVSEILEKIMKGEDFGEIAKEYSHGHRSQFGGLWKAVEPDSLAEPYDVLAEQAKQLQPGQISEPIEVTGHIFIMKLEDKQAGHVEPFEEVQDQIEAQILLDRRKQVVDKLSARLAQQVSLTQQDEFIDFCLREVYRISNQ